MRLGSQQFSGRLALSYCTSLRVLVSRQNSTLNASSPLVISSRFVASTRVSEQSMLLRSTLCYSTRKDIQWSVAPHMRSVVSIVGRGAKNGGRSSIFVEKRWLSVSSVPRTSLFFTAKRWQHNYSSSYPLPGTNGTAPSYHSSNLGPTGHSTSCFASINPGNSHQHPYYSPQSFAPPPPPPSQWIAHQPSTSFPYVEGTPQVGGDHPSFFFPPSVSPASSSTPLGSANNPVIVKMEKRSKIASFISFLLSVFVFVMVMTLVQIFIFGIPVIGLGDDAMDSPRPGVSGFIKDFAPKPVNLDTLEVTFSTIRGCDEAKEELQDLVRFLKDPEQFTSLGGRLPKGFLLVGPPGCGKTLLAKAIAKEANVNFFYVAGSEFEEMFVGVGSRRIRDLFAEAKKVGPSLIFIDEIDAIAMKRSSVDFSSSRMSLNQLLSEMDGFQSSSSVVVIAATNTPEALDKAILRPGRFDTMVCIDPPDMKGRAEVLQLYLGKIKADESVNAEEIAKGTIGFTGAELNNLVNLAAIRAGTLQRSSVTVSDIEYARERIMMGSERKKSIPLEEKRIVAYHEGGHALAALLLQGEGTDPVHKATIIPRGNGVLGLVQQVPSHDRYSETKQQCLARIKVCLAGRVAEEMLLGEGNVTTGASSDFQSASEMARSMVRKFGFSDRLGLVFFDNSSTPEGAYLADDTKKAIDEEVHKLVSAAYVDTRKLLSDNKEKLERIAKGLLERETLSGEELTKILNGETLSPSTSTSTRVTVGNSPQSSSTTPPVSPIPLDRCSVPI